ncbi:hypothetical protein ATJ93_4629, partial [Halopiger aswanensis]
YFKRFLKYIAVNFYFCIDYIAIRNSCEIGKI